jgi:hypothetical protein
LDKRLAGNGYLAKYTLRNCSSKLALLCTTSGFGGLALYRKEAIVSRSYAGTVNGQTVCEHVSLNADNSLRCFLNPSQITLIGTQEEKKYQPRSPLSNTLFGLFRNW